MTRILAIVVLLFSHWTLAAGPVYIGLDAEFGHKTSTSAQAVQQGMQIAIDEINQAGGVLGGRKLQLVIKDNRSVTAIAVDNLRELARMPDMVAVFGGKFSPVYIECVPLAHELGMLLMDPWGSADPITDHNYRPSYTFRLSLKDAWAGPAFVRFAKQRYKANRLGVLLPNTAWGRSNQAAIEKAAASMGLSLVGRRWYNWGDTSLAAQYAELRKAGAQAIILVANEAEGAILVREVAALPKEQRLPIISHWGVTGGDFARMAGEALQQVDFSVIQTFSFVGRDTPAARRVLTALRNNYGATEADRVKSPVGVAHAYDLTHLLARAINKAGSTDRRKIRDALEQIGSYDGLVRRYSKPFTAGRHDALSAENVFFARYTADDRLIPVDSRSRP
ncbi:branched-chain amino acid transport system substrate-binding protein [Formivibrio citricus]|uniref:Branched-chain amino acid transport system substrate-binding protein n=1 Tax=Formivibrio citricus TaxID=83765 RepID=A0A1I4WLW3_9NEIS|nr:ABC transporter substrate-binding protein [Formivibrio citricus]SFN13959.1 branched-chain amino acid transport system substrate-binding protein [Formivibrio citricus]